jgi:hypothetical protein
MIVSAQGEAMSAELIGRAVQRNAGYVTLRRIETAKEISRILAQGNNRLVLDADSLLLNVRDNEKYSPLNTPQILSYSFSLFVLLLFLPFRPPSLSTFSSSFPPIVALCSILDGPCFGLVHCCPFISTTIVLLLY